MKIPTNKDGLDLQLFGEETDTAPESVKEESLSRETGGQEPLAPDAGEQQDADAFEELIRGRYKKAFDARVQKILDGRLRKARTEQETLQKVQSENQSLRAGRAEKAKAILDRLEQSAPAITAIYPNFDWRKELQNEAFGRLVAAGADPRAAYEVAHREEVLRSAMAYSAGKTREKIALTMAGGGRVPENGSLSHAAAVLRTDPGKLTPQELKDIRHRVQNGEKIRF